jgi:OmpA-OmpF porin, OOP family
MAKTIIKPIRVMGMAAPFALLAGLVLSPQAWSADSLEYVTDTGKEPFKTSYGECWKSSGVFNPMEACGDKAAAAAAEGGPCADADGDGVCDDVDKCPGTRPGARVDADGCEMLENMVINLDVDEFDFDKATLKPAMKTALDDLAGKIKATPHEEKLTLIGHTDSKGSDAYNMKLGQRRATAVKAYLAKKGIAAGDMTAKSMGESQPVATNKTDQGRAQNRRVEVRAE